MKIPNHHDMEDFRTVVAMSSHYVTCEPFLIGEYDLRIQVCHFDRISVPRMKSRRIENRHSLSCFSTLHHVWVVEN